MTLRSSKASSPPDSGSRPRGRWYRYLLLKAVLILIVLAVVASVGSTPWAFRIGGGFTPLAQWRGYGPVRSTDGGRYVLYAQFQGGLLLFSGTGDSACSVLHGCDTLRGSAELCGPGGVYTFQLRGQIHAWERTEGARTVLHLSGNRSRELPDVITFTGRWHGGTLRLPSSGTTFTRAFTEAGHVRRHELTNKTSTATAALHAGSQAAFASACRSLAS